MHQIATVGDFSWGRVRWSRAEVWAVITVPVSRPMAEGGEEGVFNMCASEGYKYIKM